MSLLRGGWRITILTLILALGTIVILAIAWIPVSIRGIRLGAWPITIMARMMLRLFNIQVNYANMDRFETHQGFIFPNHTSPIDVVVLVAIIPMRFLAKIEIRSWPFIGWIATAVGTVFVNRSDKESRQLAREALLLVNHYPPIVLFPEGGILAPCGVLHPFRFGAFEIAAKNETPFMPLAIRYDPLEIAYWGDESLWDAIWRLASYDRPLLVELQPLRLIHPTVTDDPRHLALETHGAVEAVLFHREDDPAIVQPGI